MKFSIRDLFLVTMIVALVLGWVLDHFQMNHKMQGIIRLYDSAAGRLNAIESNKIEAPVRPPPAPNPPKP